MESGQYDNWHDQIGKILQIVVAILHRRYTNYIFLS